MKLVRFSHRGQAAALGALVDDLIVDLSGASASGFADPLELIAGGADALRRAEAIAHADGGARYGLDEVRMLAPIVPATILCAGSNYKDHNAEKAASPTSGQEPEFFLKSPDCVIGPDDDILLDPELTKKLDCENELAIVIGREGRHIPVEQALDHVFGYMVANDVTARDRQVQRTPHGDVWYELCRSKAFDTSAPLGPVIVTSDEIGDPQALQIRTRINGEVRQSDSTAGMIWSCAELIHFFSINFTLRPGTVILTGTPSGTAWSADESLGGHATPRPGVTIATRYCEPGDQVECEIEGIGVLRNRIGRYGR